jgi:predicted nucleotide-binding protein (sugar kinase/HSP70/actin superfamily)
VTGKSITVPPHNEVTGALGCALIALSEDVGKGNKFKGFDLSKMPYDVASFECQDCTNHCEINKVTIEGESPLHYGSRCEKFDINLSSGSDYDLPDLFAEREQLLLHSYRRINELPRNAPRVGIPRALLFHELFPLWHGILSELGCEIILSERTNKQIMHDGSEHSVAETCFPMKIALGHVLDLVKKEIDYVFLPNVINLEKAEKTGIDSFVCPYVQSFAHTVQAAVDFSSYNIEVLRPVIHLQLGERQLRKAIEEVAEILGCNREIVKSAVAAGIDALNRFRDSLKRRGKQILALLPDDKPTIVIVSRSYNGCDLGSNLEIPRKLMRMGVLVVPMDFLPLDDVKLSPELFNMYWRYGQKILSAGKYIADKPKLNALYLTNFGCGPDSFIIRYFQDLMGYKPVLNIEVDEHSADAGIITRCEAFLDSLQAIKDRSFKGVRSHKPITIKYKSQRKIMIPNMSSHARALSAAFKACDMAAEVLPPPDEDTMQWGRKYTSGKECLPCIVTTGDMVKFLKTADFDRNKIAFFIGSASGPCRFGQYNTLQRMVLDDLGYEDVPIFAPNQASSLRSDLKAVSPKFASVCWKAMVAVDLLEKALLQVRPYEIRKGSANIAYNESLIDVCEAVAGKKGVQDALRRSRKRFEAVSIDRNEKKPIIGIVGEFYIRFCRFSNRNLIEQIEQHGGECWIAPAYEWFFYLNFRQEMRSKLEGDLKLRLKSKLQRRVMKSDENRILAAFDGFLRNPHEPSTDNMIFYAKPYLDKSLEGEAIMTIGKVVDFIRKGLSGIVSVMPFTCMPGTIAYSLMKRVRENEVEIPFLNMVYDGFEQSNALIRLEAFMHQSKQFSIKHI